VSSFDLRNHLTNFNKICGHHATRCHSSTARFFNYLVCINVVDIRIFASLEMVYGNRSWGNLCRLNSYGLSNRMTSATYLYTFSCQFDGINYCSTGDRHMTFGIDVHYKCSIHYATGGWRQLHDERRNLFC